MKTKGSKLAIGLLLLALVCGGIAVKSYLEEKYAGSYYEDLREDVMIPTSTSEATETPATKEPVVIPVDFAMLQGQCPDIYAWIRIPGTEIDYPIVQKEGDNGYYLNHTIYGQKKAEGSIFTEDYNSKDFEDPNTVIYGHNMKNGSMFKGLHGYRDRSFFKEHQEVLIYMPDRILHYQVFAAYIYDNRHLMESFDFKEPQVFTSYIDSILSRSHMGSNIDGDIEITAEDKIITLSTCNGNDNERFLVQAVLLSIEK